MNVVRVMRVSAVALALLWTALCVGAYLLLGAGGEWLSGSSHWLASYPDLRHWLEWSLQFLAQFGAALTVAIWILGVFAIALFAWAGSWAWRRITALELTSRLAREATCHGSERFREGSTKQP